jgi:hypothetical protein
VVPRGGLQLMGELRALQRESLKRKRPWSLVTSVHIIRPRRRSRGLADPESSLLCLVVTRLYRHVDRHDVAAHVISVGRPACPSARFARKRLTIMNEKPQVVRSPEPGVGAAREAEERRVAEIAREIEELGRALEGRDRPARFGTAERAKGWPAQVGQTAGAFSLTSGGALMLMSRAIEIAQDAYRRAVAEMQRLTARENAETEVDARKAAEENALAEERKAAEEKFAAVAAARREEAPQAAEDAPLKADEAARKPAEGKPKSDAEAKEQAERAEAALAQERARTQELELQLAVRRDATPDRGRSATASPSDRPTSMPTAPEAPGNLEVARLMAQARLLLDQGNIIAARSVLERAAESGSALALFLLAETYDRAILSAWGIFGRLSNVTKARELYAKAVAGGVHEAKYRLSALR